jgi:hypothetical protein
MNEDYEMLQVMLKARHEYAFWLRQHGKKLHEIGLALGVCVERARSLVLKGKQANSKRQLADCHNRVPQIQGFPDDIYGKWIGEK